MKKILHYVNPNKTLSVIRMGQKGLLRILIILMAQPFCWAQNTTPAEYWTALDSTAKTAFVNGVYATVSAIRKHHQQEVNKQYKQIPGWIQPYYINRFYEILDQHISREVEYNLEIITRHVDALYSNYDNVNIPIVEAIRIVSVAQDGARKKANLLLLQAQQKYKH